MKNDNTIGRRGVLLAAGRWCVGGLLAVGAAGLGVKRRRLVREGKCIDPDGLIGCRDCKYLAQCSQPKALSAKKNIRSHDVRNSRI